MFRGVQGEGNYSFLINNLAKAGQLGWHALGPPMASRTLIGGMNGIGNYG